MQMSDRSPTQVGDRRQTLLHWIYTISRLGPLSHILVFYPVIELREVDSTAHAHTRARTRMHAHTRAHTRRNVLLSHGRELRRCLNN